MSESSPYDKLGVQRRYHHRFEYRAHRASDFNGLSRENFTIAVDRWQDIIGEGSSIPVNQMSNIRNERHR